LVLGWCFLGLHMVFEESWEKVIIGSLPLFFSKNYL